MRLEEVVRASRRVSETRSRREKIAAVAELLGKVEPGEVEIAVAYLSGAVRQSRLGVGPASLRESFPRASAAVPTLTLTEVDEALEAIAATTGSGSAAERVRALRGLLEKATREEQEFLPRLLLGELRQGALEGVMIEAIARAARASPRSVRRAVMLSGDLGRVARAALEEGEAGLSRFDVRLFHPVLPMLAQTAETMSDALRRLGRAAVEHKLDGARIQVHRRDREIRVFTRRLNEVTAAVPEIVEAVLDLPARELILDGEAIALRRDGRPHPFQVTMSRFGRRLDVARQRQTMPLACFFFDCLLREGESLVDRSTEERFEALATATGGRFLVPRIVTGELDEAESFAASALRSGHEGVMLKSLAAPYEAGARGQSWLKLKPAHTLDLVVLAAEWGHGRRRGWLSNLHLGARDPESGGYVMLGKTFKGMTDEMLEWQTRRLLELETSRDPWTVRVRPELVVEVAFNDIQASPHYPGGVALRFARVKGYRADKRPEESDTIEMVRALHQAAAASEPR